MSTKAFTTEFSTGEPKEPLIEEASEGGWFEDSGRTATTCDYIDTNSVGEEDDAPKAIKGKKTCKHVCFGEVGIHTHKFILGDNPSVKEGLPLSFDWEVEMSEHLDLEEYEVLKAEQANEPSKKTKVPRRRTVVERFEIIQKAGHSIRAMVRVEKEIRMAKQNMSKPGDIPLEQEDDEDESMCTSSTSMKKGIFGGRFGWKQTLPKKKIISVGAA